MLAMSEIQVMNPPIYSRIAGFVLPPSSIWSSRITNLGDSCSQTHKATGTFLLGGSALLTAEICFTRGICFALV